MALPILDGNQSPTTLSTIIISNAHVPAHTVTSLGTQAITDIATAVSGVELGPNTLNALENITVTMGQVTITGGLTNAQLRASAVTIGGGVYLAEAQVVLGGNAPAEAVQIGGYNLADNKLYPIAVDNNGVQSVSGTVTANIGNTPDFIGGGYTNLTEVLNDGAIVVQSIETTINANVNEVSVLPPITGTVTANPWGNYTPPISAVGDSNPESGMSIAFGRLVEGTAIVGEASPLPISGTVTASVPTSTNLVVAYRDEIGEQIVVNNTGQSLPVQVFSPDGGSALFQNPLPISGTITVGNSVTIGSLPVQLSTTTIGGTARLNVTLSSATTVGGTAPSYANLYGGSDGTNLRAISVDTSGRTVVTGSVSIASTTVTVSALPNGALTTRFGSVTTANTSQLTSCVTNSSRKYLLAQNISAGTVTIGIGFSPTTTQGIQLSAGGGISFDSFCPTGAVWWLGATTGANFTILEG